jgi:hypothetical protein
MVRIKKGVYILVITGYYLPGYKGGGPIRTLANMVDRLGSRFLPLIEILEIRGFILESRLTAGTGLARRKSFICLQRNVL